MAIPDSCLRRDRSGLFWSCFCSRRGLISGVCRRLRTQRRGLVLGAKRFSRSRLVGRLFHWSLFHRSLDNRGLDDCGRFAGAGEGVGAGVDLGPIATAAPRASAPGVPPALGPSAFWAGSGLGPVGGDDLAQLAILKQLGHGAQGQAQGRHGRAQAKGLLDGAGGAHLVVAEADAEAAGFPAAAFASTSLTTAFTTTSFPSAFATTAFPSATPAAETTVLLALGAG